jgi:hypothetical protein
VTGDQWLILWSPEVKEWYSALDIKNKARADRILGLLAEQGPLLGMPHSRLLGDGLRELRFICEDVARRITYILEPERRVITLTTFRKQRQNEAREITRARNVLKKHRTRQGGGS